MASTDRGPGRAQARHATYHSSPQVAKSRPTTQPSRRSLVRRLGRVGWDASRAWRTGMGSPPNRRARNLVQPPPVEVGWAAEWYEQRQGGPDFELYCDIIGPLSWHGTVVTMVDLDLDVIRTFSGETRLVDEDEFELHRVELDYPAWMIALACVTAAQLIDHVLPSQTAL